MQCRNCSVVVAAHPGGSAPVMTNAAADAAARKSALIFLMLQHQKTGLESV
jgi:hypothetical protein